MGTKTSTTENGVGLIQVAGSLMGGDETDKLRQAIAGFVSKNYEKLVIDLSGADYINSTGIGVLVSAHTTYTRKGWKLRVCGINKKIDNIFVITKLSLVLDVVDTQKEALEM